MNSKEFDELESRLEAYERDAKRYRWLRSQPENVLSPLVDVVIWTEGDGANNGVALRFEDLDRAIDVNLPEWES